MKVKRRWTISLFLVAVLASASACGHSDLRAPVFQGAGGGAAGGDGPDGGSSNHTASGHVYAEDGRPIAGATVEFKRVGCPNCDQPWTTTDSTGAYSIELNAGVYNALCVSPDICGPRGDTSGGPYPVTIPGPADIDFVACAGLDDYPGCLGS